MVPTPRSIAATGWAGSGFDEVERLDVAAGLPRAIIQHDADRVGVATVETYGMLPVLSSLIAPVRVMYGKLRVCRATAPLVLLGARSSERSSDASSCSSHCRERSEPPAWPSKPLSDEQGGDARAVRPGRTSG